MHRLRTRMGVGQFPPPAHLTDTVRCFWTVHSPMQAGAQRSFNTMPDGFPGLMVLLPGGAPLLDHEHGAMPTAFLYGQATNWRNLRADGPTACARSVLPAHALRTVFSNITFASYVGSLNVVLSPGNGPVDVAVFDATGRLALRSIITVTGPVALDGSVHRGGGSGNGRMSDRYLGEGGAVSGAEPHACFST